MNRGKNWKTILYTSLISLSGIPLLLFSLIHLKVQTLDLAYFILFGIIAEVLSVELFSNSRGSRVSVSSVIVIACIISSGHFAGTILSAAIGLSTAIPTSFSNSQNTSKGWRSALRRASFNAGMLAISTYLAGTIYTSLGGEVGSPTEWGNIIPLIGTALSYEIINIAILLGVLTIQTGNSPLQLWVQNFQWGLPISLGSNIIGGGALAIAYESFNVLGLLVFLLPVIASSYAFRIYIKHTKEYVQRLEQANITLDETNTDLLETLGAVIDAYDIYTYGHSTQIAIYVDAISEEMKLPEEERSTIVKAALVHDIGKIGIMESIVGKRGPLSKEEYLLMQRHPVIGADILRKMKGLQDLVPLVRHHHEHWDGSGYPAGLAGEEIPLGARIIALADAVDAMCSQRPYRRKISLQEVKAEIKRKSGSQFDPNVVTALFQVIDKKGDAFFKDSSLAIKKLLDKRGEIKYAISTPYLLKRSLMTETEN